MGEPTSPTPARQGPRPLPLHLLAHASTLMASRAVLPFWKNGSLPWRPSLQARAEELRQSLAAAGPEGWQQFDAAVGAEALVRHTDFLAGLEAYRHHPYSRSLPEPPVIWSEGTTRLLDYRTATGQNGVPVLIVPSLINRAYVLDLTPQRSLVRYLADKGLAPFMIDWGAPGLGERDFTLTDYVAGRMEAALDKVTAETGRSAGVLGYCMGGTLALALAQRRPEAVRRLVLLATPWDFHAGREAHAQMMRALSGPLGGLIQMLGEVPVDLLQALFMGLDPGMAGRKFQAFSRMEPRSARARDFVALEDWANDGVALAGEVARQCLFGWYGDNEPALETWTIAGRPVRPDEVKAPTLLVIPARDRIVPPESALPLAEAIPNTQVLTTKGGHVGMMIAAKARTELYGPVARWLGH